MTYRETKNMQITTEVVLTDEELQEAVFNYLHEHREMGDELPNKYEDMQLRTRVAPDRVFISFHWEKMHYTNDYR